LLSATFSKRTVDLLRLAYSEGENWLEFRCDKLRTEIHFDVIHAKSYSEKKTRLLEMVPLLPHPMIIYVNRPDEAIELQKELSFSNIKNTRIFTGRTTSNEREKIIEEWSNDEFSIMIATCAFGVGVDKKDVRTVIHAYVPENPNKYYQEAGRGGRDGLPCLAVMLFTDADIDSAFSFTSKVLTVEKLTGRWFSMLNSPKTVRKVGGFIKIDTSIKPSYIESDEFDWANEADINWNVYVILLLRRAGLLEIVDVEYDRRYLFTVYFFVFFYNLQ
jgi:ATP-dependent DNA helicase RecQ